MATTFIAVSDQKIKDTLYLFLTYSVCDKPIHFHVDSVDSRFNLSKDIFLNDVSDAAKIWSNIYGKNLFVYDEQGILSVNLIYDERQSLNTQVSTLENTVKSENLQIKPKLGEYQKLSEDFKQKAADLNKEIADWNSKGGAPSDQYQILVNRQKDLKSQANSLNAMARSLNSSTDVYNDQVSKLNTTINDFNSAIQARPEEGIFKGPENRIEIYFNISNQELIHTIAHELGHSLGLDHNNNPSSIMYFKTNQKLIPSKDDIAALTNVCKRHQFFELIYNYLKRLRFKYNLS